MFFFFYLFTCFLVIKGQDDATGKTEQTTNIRANI